MSNIWVLTKYCMVGLNITYSIKSNYNTYISMTSPNLNISEAITRFAESHISQFSRQHEIKIIN